MDAAWCWHHQILSDHQISSRRPAESSRLVKRLKTCPCRTIHDRIQPPTTGCTSGRTKHPSADGHESNFHPTVGEMGLGVTGSGEEE